MWAALLSLMLVTANPPPPPTELTLAGQMDAVRLLDLAAKELEISIDYDAAQVKQAGLVLRTSGPIDRQGLWQLVNRTLAQKGLTTVNLPGTAGFTVVKLEDAPKVARVEGPLPLADALARSPWAPTGGFRNLLVQLRYVSPKDAADTLKSLTGKGGSSSDASVVPVNSGQRLLLLSDQFSRIDEVLRILQLIDVPERETIAESVPVRNLAPAQVVTAVSQIMTKREAVGSERLPGDIVAATDNASVLIIAPRVALDQWKMVVRQADQLEPVQTLPYTPRVFAVKDVASLIQQIAASASPVDDRFRALVEEPTSTVIVTATMGVHERIRELMERLDSVPSEARRPMRAFVVRNRPVKELLEVLQQMVAAGALQAEPEFQRSGADGLSPAPLPFGALPTVAGTPSNLNPPPLAARPSRTPSANNAPPPVSLSADEATNTIIAIGEARLLGQLEVLLKAIDVRQPQVMLEVVLVTLSERDSLSLGVELQYLFRNGETRTALSSLFGLSEVLDTGPAAALNPIAAAGFTGAVINPGDFSVILKAIQSLGKGRSVSLPRVLVSNNQNSEFNALTQEPYGVSFTQGNASSTSVTFGGTLDAGTKLSIKPQISEAGSLLLDYTISLSSFSEQGRAGNLPPTRQVNSLQSLATVPDGHIVVVGGLETAFNSESADQLPLLGSIPILGNLFKNQSMSRSSSKFFVFIRASVMRNDNFEALGHITAPALEQADLPPNWPVTEPQVIK